MLVSPATTQEEPPLTFYSPEELSEWIEQLRGFDEIRMTLAEKWMPHPIGQKKDGSIEFTEKRMLDTPLHDLSNITDPDSFVRLLAFAPKVPKLAHGCFGLFNLAFYKRGELVGGLHYAHGKYWQPLTVQSQDAVTRWLIQHGFPIEETMKLDKQEPKRAPETMSGRTSARDSP